MLLTECLGPKPFESFGGSRWSVVARRPLGRLTLPSDLQETRAQIRAAVPAAPGVYGMVDAEGQLIYVGKSKRLQDRLVSYFHTRTLPEKADRIVQHATRLVWQCVPDEFAALLRELELIQRWRPRLNVQGQPGRIRRTFICIGRPPASRAYLLTEPGSAESVRFGPVPGGRATRRAVERLNDLLGLRDCPVATPMIFAEQKRLFPIAECPRCIRFDLGNCLGPCAGRCSQVQYNRRVRDATDFLAGRSDAVLRRLKEQMQVAAEMRQFEKAATLRDARADLERLYEHLNRLRQVRGRDRFVYRLSESPGRETWYFLAEGQVVEAAPAPRNRRAAARRLRTLENHYRKDRPLLCEQTSRPLDVAWLVASWFRTRRDELNQALVPERAMELCRAML